jgi:hypothetical protein
MQFQFIARLSAKLIVVALALLLGAASQASAATITATFKGTVASGLDTTGVFGTPGKGLAGSDYALVFTVDSTVGAYSTIIDPLFSGDQIFGGISAVLTINGHSYAFTGTGSPSGNFNIATTKPGLGILAYQFSNALDDVHGMLQTNNPPTLPTSVFTAVALSSCPAGSCTFSGGFNIPISSLGFLSGTLNFGSLTVTTTPIPAALPLLVSALGGLGFVGWRRKQTAAA